MSQYTTQLLNIVKQMNYPNNNTPINQQIKNVCPFIFDFPYPIFVESYRRTLEEKIIRHYIMKEICCETYGLWKMFLEDKMNLIMPYYNELYKTTLWEFDALTDIDLWETYEGSKNNIENVLSKILGNNSSKFNSSDILSENTSLKSDYSKDNNGNINETGNNLSSDLPQANYAGLDYGTNLNEIENNSSSTNHESGSNTDSTNRSTNNNSESLTSDTLNTENNTNRKNSEDEVFTRHTSGLAGKFNPAELLLKYREAIINIDQLIINDLHDLFMLVY